MRVSEERNDEEGHASPTTTGMQKKKHRCRSSVTILGAVAKDSKKQGKRGEQTKHSRTAMRRQTVANNIPRAA